MSQESACICSSRDLFHYGCRCVGNKVLRVWHNGIDWVAAHDIDEARALVKAWAGYNDDEVDGDEGWSVVTDDTKLTFHDGPDDDSKTTLSAKDWIDEIGKPEYMGSREF